MASLGRALEAAGTGRGPGLFALVADHGEVVFTGSAGTADLEYPRPIGASDRFRIASATKMFTATIVLRLAAAGGLSLTDAATSWLPAPVRALLPLNWPASVGQLLAMRSGLPDYVPAIIGDPPSLAGLHRDYLPADLIGIAVAQPTAARRRVHSLIHPGSTGVLRPSPAPMSEGLLSWRAERADEEWIADAELRSRVRAGRTCRHAGRGQAERRDDVVVEQVRQWLVGRLLGDDTASGTGFCAEHAAIAAMVTAGEYQISKIGAPGCATIRTAHTPGCSVACTQVSSRMLMRGNSQWSAGSAGAAARPVEVPFSG